MNKRESRTLEEGSEQGSYTIKTCGNGLNFKEDRPILPGTKRLRYPTPCDRNMKVVCLNALRCSTFNAAVLLRTSRYRLENVLDHEFAHRNYCVSFRLFDEAKIAKILYNR